MTLMTVMLFVVGLGLLVGGADVFVRGASRVAIAAGISRMVVGLTIVAYGTSAPEMIVSVTAGLGGQPDLALGNVVGSNIFNVLFILGICALIIPINVARQLLRTDVLVMIGVSVLLLVLSLDGSVGFLDGLLLFAGIVGYTIAVVTASRKAVATGQVDEPGSDTVKPWLPRDLGFVIGGLTLLVVGSRMFVEAATTTAKAFGVSELVIGLTIVAAGTSLPEVATSVVAALRGERDIAVGNVVGSNIFNILGVLGVTALVSPAGVPVAPSLIAFDLPLMVAVAVACFPIFLTGYRIERWEGGVFFFYYVAYTLYLILAAQEHDLLKPFSQMMLWFVVPVTVLTLMVVLVQGIRQKQGAAPLPQAS